MSGTPETIEAAFTGSRGDFLLEVAFEVSRILIDYLIVGLIKFQ